MLPVVSGARETRRQVMVYTLILVPVSMLPWILGFSGPIYGVAATLLGAGFVWHAWRVLADHQDAAGVSLSGDAPAKAAFRYSIAYLFAVFTALAVDRALGG